MPRCHGLGIDDIAVLDEPGDVGDRIMEDEVAAAAFDREGLVEVGRTGRIEGDERPVGSIDMFGGRSPGRDIGGGRRQRTGKFVGTWNSRRMAARPWARADAGSASIFIASLATRGRRRVREVSRRPRVEFDAAASCASCSHCRR
jgi:hypothetical protein